MATYEGIDISHNNGSVNLEKAKQDGIKFVMIRMGYGSDSPSQDDKQFENNVQKAENANLDYGLYFYSYALNMRDVQDEINHAKRLLKGKNPSYPVSFDMEDADGYKQNNGMPSNTMLANICEKWLDAMEQEGYYVSLYASRSWLENQLDQNNLVRFDKWLADWNTSPGYKYDDYTMWQYTSTGRVNGITGNVDRNISYTNYQNMGDGGTPNSKSFQFPVDQPRRITQGMQGAHNGIDIAGENPGDRVPIYAIASGKVVRSYVSTSYGECIFLEHNVNGKRYQSVYAHMTTGSRKVKKGDTVTQHQHIGKMGNTGDSQGVHLHFELHQPEWNANKTHKVNPLDYLTDNPNDNDDNDNDNDGNNGGNPTPDPNRPPNYQNPNGQYHDGIKYDESQEGRPISAFHNMLENVGSMLETSFHRIEKGIKSLKKATQETVEKWK